MPTARSSVPSPSGQHHRPPVPSGLRQAELPPSSPEDQHHLQLTHGQDPEDSDGNDTTHPTIPDYAAVDWDTNTTQAQGEILDESRDPPPDARTALLGDGKKYHIPRVHDCGEEGCQHGTLSPRPRYQRGYGSLATDQGTDGARRESYLDSRAHGQIGGGEDGKSDGGWWRSERWTYVETQHAHTLSNSYHNILYELLADMATVGTSFTTSP